MFITVKKVRFRNNVTANKALIKAEARQRLALCKLTGTDIQIDNYCKEKYKKPLKAICMTLIKQSTVQYNAYTGEYIIIYRDPNLDKLASIITYGTGAILGSSILIDCFNGKR